MPKANQPNAVNRRTNLGVLLLLSAMTLFGVIVAIVNATGGNPIRYGVGLGISLSGALALCTYAVLVIRKATRLGVPA